MKAVELMETLAKVIEKNPKVDVSFMINEEDIKDFGLGMIEETKFFDIGIDALSEEDVVFIFLKKGIET